MENQTSVFLELMNEARTRFSNQLPTLTEADLKKKLAPSPNSIGFLIRHIGDVEFLFAKNVFKSVGLQVKAQTVIDKFDSGEWTNLEALLLYVEESFKALHAIVEQQTTADWNEQITTNEFGTKTKAEALGRIISHTAYHAGQIALIQKYGAF